MRVRLALLTSAALLTVGACSASGLGDGSTSVPKGTPIRTAPPDSTGPDTPTTPLVTAYRTLPSVTAAPPLWAPPGWRTPEVERFVTLVEEELDALGADADVLEERGFALLDNGTQIPLSGLAARLVGTPDSTWRAEISAFLLTALRPTSPDDFPDYETASPLLRIRVGVLSTLGLAPSAVISQVVAGDLVMIVVIDVEDRTLYITPAQADLWGKTAQELLLVAAAQTLAQPETPDRQGPFTSLTDDRYAASRVIDPRSLAPEMPDDGLVIAIPAATSYLSVDVDTTLDEATLLGMALQARTEFAEADEPVSEHLYWWDDGVFEVITLDGDELVLPAQMRLILGTE